MLTAAVELAQKLPKIPKAQSQIPTFVKIRWDGGLEKVPGVSLPVGRVLLYTPFHLIAPLHAPAVESQRQRKSSSWLDPGSSADQRT